MEERSKCIGDLTESTAAKCQSHRDSLRYVQTKELNASRESLNENTRNHVQKCFPHLCVLCLRTASICCLDGIHRRHGLQSSHCGITHKHFSHIYWTLSPLRWATHRRYSNAILLHTYNKCVKHFEKRKRRRKNISLTIDGARYGSAISTAPSAWEQVKRIPNHSQWVCKPKLKTESHGASECVRACVRASVRPSYSIHVNIRPKSADRSAILAPRAKTIEYICKVDLHLIYRIMRHRNLQLLAKKIKTKLQNDRNVWC